MKIDIDLRSDTVTLPPDGMREAIVHADLGDDFYRDDPTVNRLEERSARLMGKEAALLVLSGTMGNLVSMMSQSPPGSEVIIEQDAHIFRSEAGGAARIAGIMLRRVPGVMGCLDPDTVERQITKKAIGAGGASLISVEQTHNAASGTVLPQENLAALKEVAGRHGLKVHMDGARIFNAATVLGLPAREIAAHADTLTFCLSKGLCCPLGAVVCGSKQFIAEARHNRQVLGGGMRQAGIIAAAGIWALDNMVERLAEDHINAKRLAQLAFEAGFRVNLDAIQTNILRMPTTPVLAEDFLRTMNDRGIDVLVTGRESVRFVTHWGVNAEHIERVGEAMKRVPRR